MIREEFAADTPLHEEPAGFFVRATVVNLCLLLALVVPLCLLAFRPPVEREKAERARLAQLDSTRDQLRAEKADLRLRYHLLLHDPDYLEVIARDELQMQKDGEVVFQYQ